MLIPPSLTDLIAPQRVIPLGRTVDWKRAQHYSQLAGKEKVPLLEADVDPLHWATTAQPCVFGMGSVPIPDGSQAVTMRFQWGRAQCYWLAHPDDPGLWQLLEAWSAARRCAFLFNGRGTLALALDFDGISAELRSIGRSGRAFDAGLFADRAIDLAGRCILELTATSDIAVVPKLEYVQVCVLATRAVLEARPPQVVAPESASRH